MSGAAVGRGSTAPASSAQPVFAVLLSLQGMLGQLQVEGRAAAVALRGPKTSAMLLCNGAGKGESQPRAGGLRGDEWIENVGHLLGRDTGSRVADLNKHA